MKKPFTPTDEPQFCIIAPTAYLSTFAAISKTHLVLAHLVDTDDEYAKFYHDLSESTLGHRIIMDNGAFELGESYAPDKLITLGTKCGAQMVVLPDYPNQPKERTMEAAAQYGPQIKQAGFQTMFVPQAEIGNWEGFKYSYEWAGDSLRGLFIDAIGMSILNIPNALPHINRAYVRVVASAMLLEKKSWHSHLYHHYLGLNAGPALEIPSLISLKVLNSCDSSGPVWAGICGHQYSENTDSFQAVKKIKKHVDFNYPLGDIETLWRISRNIKLTLSLFGQDTPWETE